MFGEGRGVERDFRKAMQLYEVGVQAGDIEASKAYGSLLESKFFSEWLGKELSFAKALSLYLDAGAEQIWAMYRLGRLFELGRGVDKCPDRAKF